MDIHTSNSIYDGHLDKLQCVMDQIVERIDTYRSLQIEKYGSDPIEHCRYRIKSEDSMREKCRRKGLPETTESALYQIHDAIGIRVVCAFLQDVYQLRDYLLAFDDFALVEEKDYIKNVKPNGYRSLHLILKASDSYYAELQLRTISMDTWAALEHHMKYKKNLNGNVDLIVKELKRCADELASTDVSMQTIRDIIYNSPQKEGSS